MEYCKLSWTHDETCLHNWTCTGTVGQSLNYSWERWLFGCSIIKLLECWRLILRLCFWNSINIEPRLCCKIQVQCLENLHSIVEDLNNELIYASGANVAAVDLVKSEDKKSYWHRTFFLKHDKLTVSVGFCARGVFTENSALTQQHLW